MSTIIFTFKIMYIHIPPKILCETNSDIVYNCQYLWYSKLMQKVAERGVNHGSILLFKKYFSKKSGVVLDCGSWTETEPSEKYFDGE